MSRLPRITAEELLRALQRAGFVIVRFSGSHFRLRDAEGRVTTVPRHRGKTLKLKTLATILDQTGLSVDDLTR